MNNVIFGSVISPEDRAQIQGASDMGKDMSMVGDGFGAYGPAIRSGGLAGLILSGKGNTFGNNLNMPRKNSGSFKCENLFA